MTAQPTRPLPAPAERWADGAFMVTFAFRCNLACTFCMVEDVLNVFEGTSLERFRALIAERPEARAARRVIFSGGEVTLAKDLAEYARAARASPAVEHVRIQTNATRLADARYLRALLDAGVDEFFVSVHAADAAACDAITQTKGSFDAIVAGLRNLRDAGASVITNTAIVESNYRALPAIVELVAPFAPRSMEFWNYWPRADDAHDRPHVARVGDSRPHVLAALEACVARGIPPVVKWYPRCLLGEFAVYQDDAQAPVLIDDAYWDARPEYACVYEGVCADAGPCAGLSEAYLARYGWEQDLLSPRRKLPLAPRGASRPRGEVTHSLLHDSGPARAEQAVVVAWLARLGLAPGSTLAGWTLAGATRARDGGAVVITFARGSDAARARVEPTDRARRCFARTKSFDLTYARVEPELERDVAALVRALGMHVARHDRGGMPMPLADGGGGGGGGGGGA